MANKKNKKAQAADNESAKAASKASVKAVSKADKKAEKKAAKKASKKNAKPGVFARIKSYFGSVRSEMKRVTWPSKKELVNYTVAVIVSLVVIGVAIALLDAVISQGLVLVSGLRG